MENLEPKNEGFDKPGYDGRLNFHKLLKDYMEGIARSGYNNNLVEWANLLRGTYSLVAPYIKKDDAANSLKEIERAEKNSSVLSSSHSNILTDNLSYIVREQLRVATDNLYERSKHLFLPTKSDKEEVFDEQAFLEGSDL